MVFAVWAVRGGIELGEAEAAFHKAKEYGLANAGAIAQREAAALGLDPGFCRRYLANILRYDLGPQELAGMNRFRELVEESSPSLRGGPPRSGGLLCGSFT